MPLESPLVLRLVLGSKVHEQAHEGIIPRFDVNLFE